MSGSTHLTPGLLQRFNATGGGMREWHESDMRSLTHQNSASRASRTVPGTGPAHRPAVLSAARSTPIWCFHRSSGHETNGDSSQIGLLPLRASHGVTLRNRMGSIYA